MHALQLVDNLIPIRDVLTNERLGSANKPFNYLHLGAAIEMKFQPDLLKPVKMTLTEFTNFLKDLDVRIKLKFGLKGKSKREEDLHVGAHEFKRHILKNFEQY